MFIVSLIAVTSKDRPSGIPGGVNKNEEAIEINK